MDQEKVHDLLFKIQRKKLKNNLHGPKSKLQEQR